MSSPRKRWPFVLGGLGALVVIAGAIGWLWLDSFLTTQAQALAADVSKTLGRDLTVKAVSLKLLGGMGLTVDELNLGGTPDEGEALLSIAQISVRADLWQALRSEGRQIHVHGIEVRGLKINLVRLPDGATNLDRLMASLQPVNGSTETEAAPPRDLSGYALDRLALLDGEVHLIDKTTGAGPSKRVGVSDIDVVLENVKVGHPLHVALKAALLAETQNLSLTVVAAPLTNSLDVLPTAVELSIQPVDVAPLAGFVPGLEGMKSGRLQANLSMQLGAAVPHGEGPTKLSGDAALKGVSFAQTQGGQPIDLLLETKIVADVPQGDAHIEALSFDFGPAHLRGKGKISKLLSAAPQVSGLELVAEHFDPEVMAQYYPPLRKTLAGRIGGPIGLVLRGAGSAQAQRAVLDLNLTQAFLAVPSQLSKARGTPLTVRAELGGAATGSAEGALRFDVVANLSGVDFRPGELLNKSPHDSMELAVEGAYRRSLSGNRVDFTDLKIAIENQRAQASGFVELGAAHTAFDLDLHSASLNVDRLWWDGEKKGPATPSDPHRFDGLIGVVKARFGALRVMERDFREVELAAHLKDDSLTVDRFVAETLGGTIDATGTTMRLAPPERPFELRFAAEKVDLSALLASAGKPANVGGKLSTKLQFNGAGVDTASRLKNLDGLAGGSMGNASLQGLDVVGQILQPLVKALPFAAAPLKAASSTALGAELPFGVTLKDGVALLKQPLKASLPQGQLELTGGLRTDGELDLNGLLQLAPETVATLTGGKARPEVPIPVGFKLVGPLWKPEMTQIDVKPAALLIAKLAAKSVVKQLGAPQAPLIEKAIEDPEKAAREAAELARKQAEAKLAEERAKLEAQAREEAERQRQRLEEEAKKRLKGLFGR